MFSLSKIKNIKNILFAVLLLPTFAECSENYILSESRVVPAKLPQTTGYMITFAGLATAAGIGAMLKSDDSKNIAIGVSLASLAGGAIAFKYLSYFTPISKLNKAKKILEENDKKIKNNAILKTLNNESSSVEINLDTILQKYPEKDYPEITFLKNDLKKLSISTKHAQKLLEKSLNSLDVEGLISEEKSFIQNIKDGIVNWLKDIIAKYSLEKELNDEKKKAEENLKKLSAISSAIRASKDFEKHLKAYNQQKLNKTKAPLLKEKTQLLKNQNSYTSSLLNSLCANSEFMNSFFQIILYVVNTIRG